MCVYVCATTNTTSTNTTTVAITALYTHTRAGAQQIVYRYGAR